MFTRSVSLHGLVLSDDHPARVLRVHVCWLAAAGAAAGNAASALTLPQRVD